jgi:iron complex outermembrane receptor protein
MLASLLRRRAHGLARRPAVALPAIVLLVTPTLGPVARAQTATTAGPALDPVVVSADPLQRDTLTVLRPVSTIAGEALRAAEGSNLGDTVARVPGVQSSSYGPGAGRPIIRGMDSARVRVTEAGLGVADVSGASPDHRVAADTLNARQVEVLRGPATLLYGSGAIGGLINIVSERVPSLRADSFGVNASVRASSAERERASALDLQGPMSFSSSWRIEGFKQRTGDIALARPLSAPDGTVIATDRLPNSSTDTQSLSLGGGWFGAVAGTRFGAAVQRYESDYGIPNPDEPVTIRLRRDRVEAQADSGSALGPFDVVRSRFAFTDYAHREVAPDGSIGARFTNRGGEGRIELPYRLKDWRGVVGTQLQQMEATGSGEGELPQTQATAVALFVVQEQRFGNASQWHVELGARGEVERYAVQADYADGTRPPSRRFALATVSAAGGRTLAPGWDLTLSATAAQRAPSVEELYFVGAHPATAAYEIGNPDLRKERSTNIDLALRYAGTAWQAQVSIFSNRVRDYIYGFFDGSTTDVLDDNGNIEDSLSTLVFAQADARLRGAEVELRYGQSQGPQWRLWGDTVRGRLTSGPANGGNLPRMSPGRLGLDVGWRRATWFAQAAVTRVFAQERTSSFDLRNGVPESPTRGYTRLDAFVAFQPQDWPVTVTLQGRNLTNQDMRVHTSFLKDFVPLAGRSIVLGLRASL